jgi:hypothetical protein
MAIRLTPQQKQFVDHYQFEDPKGDKPARLRKEYQLDAVIGKGGEMDQLLRLSQWAYDRFPVFGGPTVKTENAMEILAAAAQGHTFYCAHFAYVFCAAATALGWVARPLSVRRSEETYHLSNHNIVELWSKERKKWILFEPTYGGSVAIDGEPVSAFEAARQFFNREGEGLQVLLGPERRAVTRNEYPFLLKHSGYGWTQINPRSFSCYGCLAWIPSNQLLGQHAGKSFENWDHWKDLYIYFGAEQGWKEDPATLPSYYPVE